MLEEALFVTTDLFEAATPKPNFINPRCFGEDFAEWLGSRLQVRGMQTRKPIQEDWGWVLPIDLDGRTFTLAIGIMDESIGVVPAVWRIGLSYERMMSVRNWLRGIPKDLFQRAFSEVKTILESEDRFKVTISEP